MNNMRFLKSNARVLRRFRSNEIQSSVSPLKNWIPTRSYAGLSRLLGLKDQINISRIKKKEQLL